MTRPVGDKGFAATCVMKQPILFKKLLSDRIMLSDLLNAGIEIGEAAREPRPEWVPLKGLSSVSDVLPPQAYANPGFAEIYNKEIMRSRRRAAFSAFWSGMSQADLEAQVEAYALLGKALIGKQASSTPSSLSCE